MDYNNKSLPASFPLNDKEETLHINTYKHRWVIGLESGNAYSTWKKPNLFRRLFDPVKHKNPYAIYDYFNAPTHLEWSIAESKRVIQTVIEAHQIPVKEKRALDISGGSGHVADALMTLGAEVILTEVNKKGIEYASETLGIETYRFDFQEDAIDEVVPGTFDLVLLRAAMMFCLDVDRFLARLTNILNPGAKVVMQYCVLPTLGVLLRTQCDEYNYLVLYQPETLIEICKRHRLHLSHREDEIDLDPYVYDHDAVRKLTLLRMWYEYKALKVIPFVSPFPLRARERRKSNLIFDFQEGSDDR